MISFALEGGPVRYNWYDLWAAAVAAISVCASHAGTGLANVEGKHPTPWCTLRDFAILMAVTVGASTFKVIVASQRGQGATSNYTS